MCDLALVLFPDRGHIRPLLKYFETAFIQMFILNLSVKSIDVSILRNPVRLNQYVANGMRWRTRPEFMTTELRSILDFHQI